MFPRGSRNVRLLASHGAAPPSSYSDISGNCLRLAYTPPALPLARACGFVTGGRPNKLFRVLMAGPLPKSGEMISKWCPNDGQIMFR